MNRDIQYIETDQRGLDSIGFLWEKLKEHHRARSPYHAMSMARMIFEGRKKDLLEKTQNGLMRIDIAKDIKTGKFVGYCISSLSGKKAGEIESIFVESAYRKHGIGDTFMKKALRWMDSHSVKKRVIAVAAGNEEVFPFYARYGFYPRATLLSPPENIIE
jgi:ribosomal protein S18 acetylase RimI-like enzyme